MLSPAGLDAQLIVRCSHTLAGVPDRCAMHTYAWSINMTCSNPASVADELRLSWMLWSGEGLDCHMTSWDNVWGMGAYVWLRETSSLLCFDLKVSLVHVFWV
jgi:hypothetical protein